jgi:hypothetical protein
MLKILRTAVLTVIAITYATHLIAAEKIDPRLATLRKAWIEPVDELGDDRLVATCLADRLNTLTPMTSVAARDEADVVLHVTAHLTSGAKRVLLGSMGGTPSAHLEATLPDGTKLWDDGAKYRRGNGAIGLAAGPACGLANGLLNALRDAMQKSRDTK